MENTFSSHRFLNLQTICKGKFHYFDQLDSTSDFARKLVAEGAESGTLVLAEHQSSGRGRGGNQWLSPAGESLLFTLVIDPDVEQALWHRFSLIAGVAIARAIQGLHHDPLPLALKWPNDIYLNNKKCAGILIEVVADKILIGVGINVAVKEFPLEISAKATSLLREGIELEREALLAAMITEIFQLGCLAGEHFEHIIAAYNDLCMLTGSHITFYSAGKLHEGRVTSIGSDGALIVDQGDGVIPYYEAKDILLIN